MKISLAVIAAALAIIVPAPASARTLQQCQAAGQPVRTELKIGSGLPASPAIRGKQQELTETVLERSDCAVHLRWTLQGAEEATLLAAMKSGSQHGGLLTGVGLGLVHRDFLVLGAPRLFPGRGHLAAAIADDTVREWFRESAREAGRDLFALAPFAPVRTFVIGEPGGVVRIITSPETARHRRVFLQDYDVLSELFKNSGALVDLGAQANLVTRLEARATEAVVLPAWIGEKLQVMQKLRGVSSFVTSYTVGALVFESDAVASLSAGERRMLAEESSTWLEAFGDWAAERDQEAMVRFLLPSRGNKVATPTVREVNAWNAGSRLVREDNVPASMLRLVREAWERAGL